MMNRTAKNFILEISDMEKVTETISLTLPSQAYTVNELLIRFQNGTLPNISQNPYYDENATFDSFDKTQAPDYDLADYTIDKLNLAHSQASSAAAKSTIQSQQKKAIEDAQTVADQAANAPLTSEK